jgi:hypothetical protein
MVEGANGVHSSRNMISMGAIGHICFTLISDRCGVSAATAAKQTIASRKPRMPASSDHR